MATFGDLYQDALDTELGSNDSVVLFTTVRRKHAINEGYRQFVDLTECVKKRCTVSVSSSAREFDLNSSLICTATDFLRVADEGPAFRKYDTAGTNILTLAGDDDFPQRAPQWMDAAHTGWRSTDVGIPTGWYEREDGGAKYFGLDRPADVSTSETAELVIPYIPKPSSMTASTDVPFTFAALARRDLQPYQQALVHYAAHDLEKIRKDTAASDRQLQKFMGYVQRYLMATRPKGQRSVRQGKSYFQNARKHGYGGGGLLAPWWR